MSSISLSTSERSPARGDSEVREISLEMPVETPECVEMTFRVAGPASRLSAFLIDTLLRVGMWIFGLIFVSCSGIFSWGLSGGMFLVFWFTIEWFYFAFCEAMFNGRTVGKHVMGLRVIQKYGYPVSWWSALSRNFVRTADACMFYGIGFVSMLMTSRFQRLGDLVAGTVVIHDQPLRLPSEPVILEKIKPLNRDDCNTFVPSERTLALIDQLLSRRTNARQRIPHERGHELAHDLAQTLSQKMDYRGDAEQVSQYSMAFLARVYVTFLGDRDQTEDAANGAIPNPLVGGGQ